MKAFHSYHVYRPKTEKGVYHGYSLGTVVFAKKVTPFHLKYAAYKQLDEIFELLDLPKEKMHEIKDIKSLSKELAKQLAYQQSISSQNGNLY